MSYESVLIFRVIFAVVLAAAGSGLCVVCSEDPRRWARGVGYIVGAAFCFPAVFFLARFWLWVLGVDLPACFS